MRRSVRSMDMISQRVGNSGISCTSMVVSLFGDVVSQHGEWIWLGSLIKALEPLGFNEGSVRTSVYRLVQSDWLKTNKVGRRSYYCFTETAIGHYEKAAQRIYLPKQLGWDGSWILVAPVFLSKHKKEIFRKSMIWQGFNSLVSGLFARPSSDRSSLNETLCEQNLVGDVLVLSAKTEDVDSQEAIKKLLENRWNLSELDVAYTEFLSFYRPLCQQIFAKKLDPEESFLLRLLLVHDYRRILLRDPDLPDEMLPRGWLGHQAYDLIKGAYKTLVPPSMMYIQQHLENIQGPLPRPNSKFYSRFGRLAKFS